MLNNTHPHVLMVYGTLKRPFSNHTLLMGARFMGEATTVEKFLMADGGFPRVAHVPRAPAYKDLAGQVRGEVYRCPDDVLTACDRLEGHPRWYCREKVSAVLDGANPTQVTAWLYIIRELPDMHSLMEPKNGLLTWGERAARFPTRSGVFTTTSKLLNNRTGGKRR